MIDIEQRTLRALEQNPLALAALAVEQRPHRIHVGQHARRDARQLILDCGARERLKAEPASQRIVVGQQTVDLATERRQIGKIHQADRTPAHLILIGRSDAAAGGADA